MYGSSYTFEPEAERGEGSPTETVSWDKGCGVNFKRRHFVGEVNLELKVKGSCMPVLYTHTWHVYVCASGMSLKVKVFLQKKNPQNPLSTEAARDPSGGNRKGGMVF